jgi:thiamine pyrophosphate-dependent acetolactate synthase large subunit-like protein
MPQILALAEKINAPVMTTFKAKGYLADSHPLAAGVLGRSGTPVAARLMAESDMLLVFGASFSKHTGIDDHLPTIQVDLDRMTLGKFHPVTVPVWADIGLTAQALQKNIEDRWEDRRPRLAGLRADWQAEKQRRRNKDQGHGLASALVFDALSGLIPDNAVIAVDVGNNTYSFGRYFECSGQQKVLMSGYLGSIGFGYPAAMGAWAACPDRPIICISGDGGFGQYMAELTTAVKYNMNITHVLLNNSELGKISKEQRAGHWEVWQTSLHNPGFAEYATLCGAKGERVTSPEDIGPAFERALGHQGPALLELITDAELI